MELVMEVILDKESCESPKAEDIIPSTIVTAGGGETSQTGNWGWYSGAMLKECKISYVFPCTALLLIQVLY